MIESGDKEVDVDVVVIYFARITLNDSSRLINKVKSALRCVARWLTHDTVAQR